MHKLLTRTARSLDSLKSQVDRHLQSAISPNNKNNNNPRLPAAPSPGPASAPPSQAPCTPTPSLRAGVASNKYRSMLPECSEQTSSNPADRGADAAEPAPGYNATDRSSMLPRENWARGIGNGYEEGVDYRAHPATHTADNDTQWTAECAAEASSLLPRKSVKRIGEVYEDGTDRRASQRRGSSGSDLGVGARYVGSEYDQERRAAERPSLGLITRSVEARQAPPPPRRDTDVRRFSSMTPGLLAERGEEELEVGEVLDTLEEWEGGETNAPSELGGEGRTGAFASPAMQRAARAIRTSPVKFRGTRDAALRMLSVLDDMSLDDVRDTHLKAAFKEVGTLLTNLHRQHFRAGHKDCCVPPSPPAAPPRRMDSESHVPVFRRSEMRRRSDGRGERGSVKVGTTVGMR